MFRAEEAKTGLICIQRSRGFAFFLLLSSVSLDFCVETLFNNSLSLLFFYINYKPFFFTLVDAINLNETSLGFEETKKDYI